MMTRLITLTMMLALLSSCGNQAKQADDALETTEATVAELLADAGPFVEQAVNVQGTVVHVCREGGQRLFLVGPDSEDRIRCTTGEDIAEFKVILEGSQVEISGIVKELIIDETYLAEWETEVMEGADEHARGEGHEGGVGHGEHAEAPEENAHAEGEEHSHEEGEHTEGETAEADHVEGEDSMAQNEAILERIQALRDEIATSGKDHLSDYWIETISFKVLEDNEIEAEQKSDE